LAEELEDVFTRNSHKLIERSAEELATYILLNYEMVRHVRLTIKKPWAPVGRGVDYVGVEIEREWHTCFLGLGSNLGDRLEYLRSAIGALRERQYIRVTGMSKIYETEPVGITDQPPFLNAVVEVKTLLTPRALVTALLEIEKGLERVRSERWGPRTVDLDLLLFDDMITSFPEAAVPHPRMHERMFVIKPLNDIAPYMMHPVLGRRMFQILTELSEREEQPSVYAESAESVDLSESDE
jgi:dihydroneopterin aldolase/2-amino-4-hydroxy-6-hydroxymethyldihydropteridine diphosphokinase